MLCAFWHFTRPSTLYIILNWVLLLVIDVCKTFDSTQKLRFCKPRSCFAITVFPVARDCFAGKCQSTLLRWSDLQYERKYKSRIFLVDSSSKLRGLLRYDVVWTHTASYRWWPCNMRFDVQVFVSWLECAQLITKRRTQKCTRTCVASKKGVVYFVERWRKTCLHVFWKEEKCSYPGFCYKMALPLIRSACLESMFYFLLIGHETNTSLGHIETDIAASARSNCTTDTDHD